MQHFVNRFFLFFVFILCLVLSSCVYQKNVSQSFSFARNITISIQMPKNELVFENLSSLLYDALWSHYARVGYCLTDKNDACYSLEVIIENIGALHKFLSPDLLTYGLRKKVVVVGRLYAEKGNGKGVLSTKSDGHVLAEKRFSFSVFLPKAKNYVDNSSFAEFKYKQLFDRAACKIEQYFRKALQERALL